MTFQGIDITLERKPIRSLRIQVKPDGTVVCRVPMLTLPTTIEAFLTAHYDWLLKARHKVQERQAEKAAVQYLTGETHMLWGRPMLLRVEEERGRESVAFYADEIVLYAHPDRTPAQRKKLLYQGYYHQFKPVFQEAFERWQSRLNEPNIEVTIRLMKTEWGSCQKQRRRMTYNVDLVRLTPDCLEYVLVHEFCHLVHADHSDAFWALCDQRLRAAGLDDSKTFRRRIRQQTK